MVVITPHIYVLTRYPVPVREQMQHILVCPFTLIHIIYIFRETCKVNNSEIATVCWESIRSRFAYIVPSRPYELTSAIWCVLHYIPCLLVCTAPWSMHVVVTAAHERRICEWKVPSLWRNINLVAWHSIITPCLECRNALCHDKRFSRKVLWNILYPLSMIVETN